MERHLPGATYLHDFTTQPTAALDAESGVQGLRSTTIAVTHYRCTMGESL
jgi:hypothetical protein